MAKSPAASFAKSNRINIRMIETFHSTTFKASSNDYYGIDPPRLREIFTMVQFEPNFRYMTVLAEFCIN
jgi:hypothetical protein